MMVMESTNLQDSRAKKFYRKKIFNIQMYTAAAIKAEHYTKHGIIQSMAFIKESL